MSKITKSARLIFVSVASNNNKFYYIDLHDDDSVRIRYGRYIEDSGGQLQTQSDTTQPGGERLFNKKLNEKTNKGYKPQPVLDSNIPTSAGAKNAGLEQIALQQIRTNSDEVKSLISFLCGINIHNITSNSAIKYNKDTGVFSTASGLITQGGIIDGRLLLSKIKDKVDAAQWDADYIELLNRFLTIVPRDFGRTRPDPKSLFPDNDEVQKQLGILDSLEASLTTVTTPKAEDGEHEPIPQLFDTGLELLRDQAQFDAIKHHFETSAKTEHVTIKHLKLKNVYTVEIAGMKKSFAERGSGKGNIHRLWHGTSSANVLSILKSGYMLTPPSTAHIAGKNFGNGLYFAPASTKSLQYSNGFWGGGSGARKIYMFLNDVAVGKAFEPKNTTRDNPPKGYDSYWARAGQAGWLINDEVVVFDTAQANPVFLLEFE
ncbi:hypothetical protein IAD21_05102 [Abditibacteriota bacterium]|nr:hypothetical protein IAD21_05102 [Abditibacteriota bacterium]